MKSETVSSEHGPGPRASIGRRLSGMVPGSAGLRPLSGMTAEEAVNPRKRSAIRSSFIGSSRSPISPGQGQHSRVRLPVGGSSENVHQILPIQAILSSSRCSRCSMMHTLVRTPNIPGVRASMTSTTFG